MNRIVVAMSGGVDSSVAAAILKNKGYEVIGLTMRLSTPSSRCCSDEDVQDARKVAKALDISHYVVDMHDVFQEKVIDYFVSEYQIGRTPNPCVLCNPMIKFGTLLDKALSLGAKFMATGHYAIVRKDEESGRYQLLRGKEKGKDQSYFLARLSQRSLSKTLFPVGTYPKHKIRALAEKLNIPVAQKIESQEVCFVPESGVAPYIESQIGKPFPEGIIRDQEENELGKHKGIIAYTIGQRKGLGIALGKPVYVTKIDAKTNTVYVGDDSDLYHDKCLVSNPHWIGVESMMKSFKAEVRLRYKHKPAHANISLQADETFLIHFDKTQRAIAPGQLAVFYDGDKVLGSAWIDKVIA